MSNVPNLAQCAADLQRTAREWFAPVAAKLTEDARVLRELFASRSAKRWVESVVSLAPHDAWTPFGVFLSPAEAHEPAAALVGDAIVARVTGEPREDFYIVARGIAARVFDRSARYVVHDIEDRDLDGLLARNVAREVFVDGAAECAARGSGFEPPSRDPFITTLAAKLVDCNALRVPDAAWAAKLVSTIAEVRQSARPKLRDVLRRGNDAPVELSATARDCGPPPVSQGCDPCDEVGRIILVHADDRDCSVFFDLPARQIRVRGDVTKLDVDMPLPDCDRCCIRR